MPQDRLRPFTQRIDRCARALELTGPDAATFARTAGPPLKDEILTAARGAFGSDLKPWTGKSAKAGTGYDIDPSTSGSGVRLTFKLRPAGVWVFGEQGAGPHLVGGGRNYKRGSAYRSSNRARAAQSKGNARYVLAAGYKHPVRAPIYHPGSKGKGAIRYAFKRFRTAQRDAAEAGVRAVVARAIR